MGADAAVESELARLRRELERLRVENARLVRLLDLRGQDTAPVPEQLSACGVPKVDACLDQDLCRSNVYEIDLLGETAS
jgi:hypothetical protein